MLLSTGIIVDAHVYSPSQYPSDLRFHLTMKKVISMISWNDSNVTDSDLRALLSYAVGDWEWLDDGYVALTKVSAPSNAYIVCSDQWPSDLPGDAVGYTKKVKKSTNIYNWTHNGSNLIKPTQEISGVEKITKCYGYINKIVVLSWRGNDRDHDIQKVWAHEIGHTVGLNETYGSTKSIMRQGRGSAALGWTDYWKPQDHDRIDLQRFNYKVWNNNSVPITN